MAEANTDKSEEKNGDGVDDTSKSPPKRRARKRASPKGVGKDDKATDEGRTVDVNSPTINVAAPVVTVESKPWKYTAYFKLWGGDDGTLPMSFGVHADNAEDHMIALQEHVNNLQGLGYSAQAGGTKPGETVQEVDAWVKGTGNNGEDRIYLYKSPLKWKVATIYVEDISKLPISQKDFNDAQTWPAAAPEREQAEGRGLLNACTFSVVLVDSGRKSDAGNTIMRFDRVLGAVPSTDVGNPKTAPTGTVGNGKKEVDFRGSQEDIQEYADMNKLLQGNDRKFSDWCRKLQANGMVPADKDRIDILAEEVDNIIEEKGVGYNFLEVITGLDPEDIYSMDAGLVDNLLTMMAPFTVDASGGLQENPKRQDKYVNAVKSIWETVLKYQG